MLYFHIGVIFLSFELSILDFIQAHFKCGFFDIVMPKISALGNGGIVWVIFTLVLLMMKKPRKYGLYMAVSLIIMLVVCNITLKPLIARTRPFTHNPLIKLLIDAPTDYSFPSGHTMASFSASTAYLMCYIRRKNTAEKCIFDSKIIVSAMFVLSVLIAFSRLYLYVHYPTDVLFALILGVIDGIVSAKIIEKFSHGKNIKNE